MASYLEVTQALGILAAYYPNFRLQKQTVDAYARILGDIEYRELETAVDQLAAESKFFPSVAELREKVLAIRRAELGLPDAYGAWNEIMGEVRRVGYESWPDARWSCDLVRDMAQRWWRDVCLGNTDDLPTIRAQFRDAYNAKARRAEDEARRLPVTNEAIKRLAAAMALPARLNGKAHADADADGEGDGDDE